MWETTTQGSTRQPAGGRFSERTSHPARAGCCWRAPPAPGTPRRAARAAALAGRASARGSATAFRRLLDLLDTLHAAPGSRRVDLRPGQRPHPPAHLQPGPRAAPTRAAEPAQVEGPDGESSPLFLYRTSSGEPRPPVVTVVHEGPEGPGAPLLRPGRPGAGRGRLLGSCVTSGAPRGTESATRIGRWAATARCGPRPCGGARLGLGCWPRSKPGRVVGHLVRGLPGARRSCISARDVGAGVDVVGISDVVTFPWRPPPPTIGRTASASTPHSPTTTSSCPERRHCARPTRSGRHCS